MEESGQTSVRIKPEGCVHHKISKKKKKKEKRKKERKKKRKLVKIKINKGIYDRDSRAQVWDYLAQETSSVIVLARGNVGVLWSNS